MQWIKDFVWFIKHSYVYMQGMRNPYFWIMLIPKAIKFANGGYNANRQ